jgi:predicted RNase H-like nuclease (RuvC/YqgF family)
MAKVGEQRSADLTGRSKSTVQRAMNSGKLSFTIDSNERRVVDVSELERVFGLKKANSQETDSPQDQEKIANLLEMERLRLRVRMLEEQLEAANSQIEDLKSQRDLWQRQANQVLLTSQYSQKQAEELKAEIKRREESARARREKLESESRKRGAQNQNAHSGTARPLTGAMQDDASDAFNFKGLWKKVKGE